MLVPEMNRFDYREYLDRLNAFERKTAPDELFWEGNISLLIEGRRVSVVGSRKASEHGKIRAKILTKVLVEQDITVVSGLADGIDTIAHNTAIELGGKTIAVLGTPLDKVYPIKNKQLLESIKKDHLAISEFPKGYPINRSSFPRRNRTMALISDATIIVEASEKSGTRHQGWEALRLGRSVFILENISQDPNLSWPSEMIKYGAQVLRRQNLSEILNDIPSFTSEVIDFGY